MGSLTFSAPLIFGQGLISEEKSGSRMQLRYIGERGGGEREEKERAIFLYIFVKLLNGIAILLTVFVYY